MPHIFTDADVQRLVSPADAVHVMENVFRARAASLTVSTPRWELPYPNGRLTFTVGAVPEGVGFRVYVRGNYPHDDQLVAVWHRDTGALLGVVIGPALGVLRTGAIGAVAVRHMAAPTANTLALIGTGRQALSQLRCIAVVRPLQQVWVYSRSAENRAAFVQEAAAYLPDLSITPVASAETAIRQAEVVVSATTSKTPTIRGAWLRAGAHVSTLGTKGRSAVEVDEQVLQRAAWVVSDTPEQTRNYPDGCIIDGTNRTLHDLGDVLGQVTRPTDDGITLFMSSGLAGTEVALAAYLCARAEG